MKNFNMLFSSCIVSMLCLHGCATGVKLKPVDASVAADLPVEAALGWLEQMPRDMNCCVTPYYPLPCQYTEEGIVTTEWESLFPARKGKNNAVRPWKDFAAKPGSATYHQYGVRIENEGTNYETCYGRVAVGTTDEEQFCTVYFSEYLEKGVINMEKLDCNTVTKDVEKSLTALKALGVTIVPQEP